MYPKYSDVFEEYAKIALEKGLISNAADDSSEDKKEDKKETKKELSNAEIMYGIKNTSSKELLEEAHPKTVVMGPAYDKFNGVVENLHQRQKIMTDIALKNPHILQTNTRYVKATEDLINETIKLGFYLDNLNNESLMKLADSCTESLTKIAAPQAAAIGVVAAIASIVALSAALNNPISQGITSDLQRLNEEIQEAVNDYEQLSAYVTGYSRNILKAKQKIEALNVYLDKIQIKYTKGMNIVNKQKQKQYFEKIANDIIQKGIDTKIKNYSQSIIALLDTIQNAGKTIKRIMTTAPEKYHEPTNEVLDLGEQLFHKIVPSDVKDVANRIEMLVESTQSYKANLQSQIQEIEEMKSALNQEDDLDEELEDDLGDDELSETYPRPKQRQPYRQERPSTNYPRSGASSEDEFLRALTEADDSSFQPAAPLMATRRSTSYETPVTQIPRQRFRNR